MTRLTKNEVEKILAALTDTATEEMRYEAYAILSRARSFAERVYSWSVDDVDLPNQR